MTDSQNGGGHENPIREAPLAEPQNHVVIDTPNPQVTVTSQVEESEDLDTATLGASRRQSIDSVSSNTSVQSKPSDYGPQSGFQRQRSHSHPDSFLPSPDEGKPLSWREKLERTWLLNKGMAMVLLSQFFGSSMNVMTRILQLDGSHGKGMHPFQILFVRMTVTVLFSFVYMWYKKVPDPFGVPAIRHLLVVRGLSGFFGVCGLYYSLLYLQLSEATVLTFLAPISSCYLCSLLLPNEVFARKQQLAGLVSLFGVILIARPFSFFSSDPEFSPQGTLPYNDNIIDNATLGSSQIIVARDTSAHDGSPEPDLEHRLIGIALALLGVLGATVAYTSIRQIGQRVHPLVSVNYFSVFATFMSLIAVTVLPSVSFRFPSNWTEISLLLGLGLAGFFLQFLLTAGLSYAPPPRCNSKSTTHGARATSMVYTQMLFALIYDKLLWNTTPSATSWAGSGIILGSALYVALSRDSSKGKTNGTKEGNINDTADSNDVNGDDQDIEQGRVSQRKWTSQDERVAHEEESQALLSAGHDEDD